MLWTTKTDLDTGREYFAPAFPNPTTLKIDALFVGRIAGSFIVKAARSQDMLKAVENKDDGAPPCEEPLPEHRSTPNKDCSND
jgi:hypothetical protein